jgi:DNA polymerase-3 subunit delta
VAAAQEVEKLSLLHGAGPLDTDRVGLAISDSARFDLFDIAEAALSGDRERMQRVINGLAAEGVAPALVLWVMSREVRMLAAAAFAARRGSSAFNAALDAHRVWASRRNAVRNRVRRVPVSGLQTLLVRCAAVDRQIKGLDVGDPWHALSRIGDELARSGR